MDKAPDGAYAYIIAHFACFVNSYETIVTYSTSLTFTSRIAISKTNTIFKTHTDKEMRDHV